MKAQLPNVLEVGVVDDLQCVVGVFDPSLSLRNDRTGLSKIPFVKTYVICFYSGIFYVSQGAEIYLYRPPRGTG